jgi:hypothetical protein
MIILPCITHAEEIKSEKSMEYVSNKLLVKFYTEVTDEKKAAIRKDLGAELIKRLQEVRFEVWKLPEGLSVDDAINKLKKEPSVECSEPDYIYKPQPTSGDSNLDRELYMNNEGKQKKGTLHSVKWNQNSYISSRSISLPIFVGRGLISGYYGVSQSEPRLMNGQDIFSYVSRAARFPAVIFSCLVRGFGFVFFAVVASFGYLLPFALFFIMAREQNDEDEIQADK